MVRYPHVAVIARLQLPVENQGHAGVVMADSRAVQKADEHPKTAEQNDRGHETAQQ